MNQHDRINRSSQEGFGLVEILITLLVMSVGILGVLGMQITAKQTNYDAIQRTTASQLVFDMVERMRANPTALATYIPGVAIGGESLGGTGSPPANTCSASPGCSPALLATYDLWQWETLIDGVAEVSDGGAAVGGLVNPRACITGPAGGGTGLYTVTVVWRGSKASANPTLNTCGEGLDLYGIGEVNRRMVSFTVYIS
jgi:type IV pilus assembly protein PilV